MFSFRSRRFSVDLNDEQSSRHTHISIFSGKEFRSRIKEESDSFISHPSFGAAIEHGKRESFHFHFSLSVSIKFCQNIKTRKKHKKRKTIFKMKSHLQTTYVISWQIFSAKKKKKSLKNEQKDNLLCYLKRGFTSNFI